LVQICDHVIEIYICEMKFGNMNKFVYTFEIENVYDIVLI